MSSRRTVPAVLASIFAFLFFGLGNYLGARQNADTDEQMAQIALLRAEIAQLKRRTAEPTGTVGTVAPASIALADDSARASIVADVKRQLQDEMGLLPLNLLRDRSGSFVELYSYDMTGASNYGTAGYLGNGYFVTVKHGVVALGDQPGSRKIASVKIMYQGRAIAAKVIDTGDAQVEVDPGDWAILKVKEPIDLPPLDANVDYGFDFAEPIFRLGNDYSKGIILSTGYVGQKTSNNLIPCLTDGHPGVSGGGVLNGDGQLVGIPIGRMQGDYRFSFILPLRQEMFRKVPQMQLAPVAPVAPVAGLKP